MEEFNRDKEWLKNFVYYEDSNIICFDNFIYLKHDLNYYL
jgi:hypothetical protein